MEPLLVLVYFSFLLCRDTLSDQGVLVTGGLTNSSATASSELLGSNCSIPDLPYERSGHITALTTDGTVIACGGETLIDEDVVPDTTCLMLDLESKQWVPHSKTPEARITHSATATIEDAVVIVGLKPLDGTNDPSFAQTFLHLTDNYWGAWYYNYDAVLSGDNSYAVGFGACAVALEENKFLVIGGSPAILGSEATRVMECDLMDAGSVCTLWPPLSQPRVSHACQKLGSNIIISGGAHGDAIISSTSILNIETKTEHLGGDMNKPRASFGMALMNGTVLAFGGETVSSTKYSQDRVKTRSIEEWDEDKEQWMTRDDTMEVPRSHFGFVSFPQS